MDRSDSETFKTKIEQVSKRLSSRLCHADKCTGLFILCVGMSLLIIAYMMEKRNRPSPVLLHDLTPPAYAKLFPHKP